LWTSDVKPTIDRHCGAAYFHVSLHTAECAVLSNLTIRKNHHVQLRFGGRKSDAGGGRKQELRSQHQLLGQRFGSADESGEHSAERPVLSDLSLRQNDHPQFLWRGWDFREEKPESDLAEATVRRYVQPRKEELGLEVREGFVPRSYEIVVSDSVLATHRWVQSRNITARFGKRSNSVVQYGTRSPGNPGIPGSHGNVVKIVFRCCRNKSHQPPQPVFVRPGDMGALRKSKGVLSPILSYRRFEGGSRALIRSAAFSRLAAKRH